MGEETWSFVKRRSKTSRNKASFLNSGQIAQSHKDPHKSNDERPILFVRGAPPTHSQSVNAKHPDEHLDEHLIPRELYVPHTPNNHHINLDTMRCAHPVILEILKGHPLKYALCETAEVPEVYLQQYWNTLHFVPGPSPKDQYLGGFIDTYEFRLTIRRLRGVLALPERNQFPPKFMYDDFIDDDNLCLDIRRLGYSQPLPNPGAFKRMHLPCIWFTLFSILNRCLSSRGKGVDRCSTKFLKLFHGVAFNHHYDYVSVIWNELVEVVCDKSKCSKDRNFVPFQRFLQLIIRSALRSNKDIPRRRDRQVGPSYEMHHLKKHIEIPDSDDIMPIPPRLLAWANQEAPSVLDYRIEHPSTDSSKPKGPTLEASIGSQERNEGPVGFCEHVQSPGGAEPGVQKENPERGIDGGSDVRPLLEEGSESINDERTSSEPHVDHDVSVRDDSSDDDDDDDQLEDAVGGIRGFEGEIGENRDRLREETLKENVEPGVTFPEFVSREYLDKALKAVEDRLLSEMASLKSHLKGKSVATDPEPTPNPPPDPPPRQIEDLSITELKELLLAKLLSQSTLTSYDTDLVGILRSSAKPCPETTSFSDLQSFKTYVTREISRLDSTIAQLARALHNTCQAQATSSKRRHDDQDDPVRHEGQPSEGGHAYQDLRRRYFRT